MKPVLAARSQDKLDALAEELGGDLETGDRRRGRPAQRARAGGERRRARDHGRSARWGRRRPPRPRRQERTTSTRPASRPSSARCSSATDPGRAGRHRDAHGVRLRLGAGQPGRRPGARPRRRAGHARGRGLLHHRQRRLDERRHEGLAGGRDLEPAFAYRDGRVQTERGAKRVRSFPVGSKQLQGVSVGSSSTSPCRAWRRACAR